MKLKKNTEWTECDMQYLTRKETDEVRAMIGRTLPEVTEAQRETLLQEFEYCIEENYENQLRIRNFNIDLKRNFGLDATDEVLDKFDRIIEFVERKLNT